MLFPLSFPGHSLAVHPANRSLRGLLNLSSALPSTKRHRYKAVMLYSHWPSCQYLRQTSAPTWKMILVSAVHPFTYLGLSCHFLRSQNNNAAPTKNSMFRDSAAVWKSNDIELSQIFLRAQTQLGTPCHEDATGVWALEVPHHDGPKCPITWGRDRGELDSPVGCHQPAGFDRQERSDLMGQCRHPGCLY